MKRQPNQRMKLTKELLGLTITAKLRCSDGTKLRLKLTDQAVEPGLSVSGVIEGMVNTRHPDDD